MMVCRGLFSGFVVCLVVLSAVPVMAGNLSGGDLLKALQQGGYVVYFRHGATTWSGVDKIEWPRSQQRLLSEKGEQQSRLIGDAFKTLHIPVGQVLSSPFARCRDMAEIAFGRVQEEMLLIGLLSDSQGRSERVAYLQEKMSTLPEEGKNRVIVSHSSNITRVTGVRLDEGDAVIVRPDGSGFKVLARIAPEDWQDLHRLALQRGHKYLADTGVGK